MKSFAQNFEDVILWRVFESVGNGFFIDIGAHHPIKDSVSKIFSESGWTGIHVEPVPFYADLIRRDRPKDKVIEALVSDKNGLCEFYNIEGTGLSTSRKDIADNHKANNFAYSSIMVSCVTLDDIFSVCPDGDIHWLKIDVEGAEKAVLSGWTDAIRRPWVVVVESTFPGTQTFNFQDWEELVLHKGYRHVYSDGLNRFYLHENHDDLSVHFHVPPNIFDGFQLTPESDHVIEIVRAHDQNIMAMESRIVAHEQALQLRTEEIVTSVRSEAREQINAALEREQALIQAGIVQQQEWEQRCARLQEQVEVTRENFLAREKNLQSRMDEIVSNVYTKERELLEAAHQHERILSQTIITQQEEYGSAIAELTKSYQFCFEQMQNNKKIIEDLLFFIEINLKFLEGIKNSKTWKFSAIFRRILKENSLDRQIIHIQENAGLSNILVLMGGGNKAPVPKGGADPAVGPVPDKSQNHENLKHQGCIDMPSQDINNVIDLISLPIDQFIMASYKLLLNRMPDQFELRLHSSALRIGLGRTKMLFDISSSPEYEACQNEIMKTKSDEEFIGFVYQRYMHRSPDLTGMAHYSSMLARGVNREQVKKDIVNSNEARLTGGLWAELDRLLKAERQQQKRNRRWFRRYRPSNRQERQEQEALLQLFHSIGERRQDILQNEHRQACDAGVPSNLVSNAVHLNFPLAAVDTSDMGPEMRRIILRLQHAKGASSLEKGGA